MNIITMPVRDRNHDPRYAVVKEVASRAHSFEQFVLLAMQNNYLLRGSKMPNPTDSRDMIVFETSAVDRRSKNESIALVTFEASEIRACYPFRPLNETILGFDDCDSYQPDNEWFDARSKRLRIRTDECEGETFAPPAALAELVFSYALSSFGIVAISRQLAESRLGVHPVARLDLTFMEPGTERGWFELINVRLDRLETLVRHRAERVGAGQRRTM